MQFKFMCGTIHFKLKSKNKSHIVGSWPKQSYRLEVHNKYFLALLSQKITYLTRYKPNKKVGYAYSLHTSYMASRNELISLRVRPRKKIL